MFSHRSLVQTLDRSLDVDSLTLSNLADLDVISLLSRYSSKIKKVSYTQNEHYINLLNDL